MGRCAGARVTSDLLVCGLTFRPVLPDLLGLFARSKAGRELLQLQT
jgi:hypothetical protein